MTAPAPAGCSGLVVRRVDQRFLNEQAGQGFGMHPLPNMEIIPVVVGAQGHRCRWRLGWAFRQELSPQSLPV